MLWLLRFVVANFLWLRKSCCFSCGCQKDFIIVFLTLFFHRLDDGAMGIGRVDPRYEGNHLGYMAIISLAQKIVQDFNVDAFFHVLRGNSKADKDLAASNAELIDTFSWISVKQNKEPYKMPWWGHLWYETRKKTKSCAWKSIFLLSVFHGLGARPIKASSPCAIWHQQVGE